MVGRTSLTVAEDELGTLSVFVDSNRTTPRGLFVGEFQFQRGKEGVNSCMGEGEVLSKEAPPLSWLVAQERALAWDIRETRSVALIEMFVLGEDLFNY